MSASGFRPKRTTERSGSRLSLRQHDADFTLAQPCDTRAENVCTDNGITKSEREGSINCVHEIDPKRPRVEAGESVLGQGANDPSDAPASDASGVRGDARSDPVDAVGRHDADEVVADPGHEQYHEHDWRFAQATHVKTTSGRKRARVYYCTRCLKEQVVRVGR